MTYAARSCLCIVWLAPVLLLPTFDTAAAQSDIAKLLRCQKTMAKAGASYANRTVKSTLKCTNEIVECQVNCDEGVYGPSCITNPPPCCDSDDPGSNEAFGDCMVEAEETCDREAQKIVSAEAKPRYDPGKFKILTSSAPTAVTLDGGMPNTGHSAIAS